VFASTTSVSSEAVAPLLSDMYRGRSCLLALSPLLGRSSSSHATVVAAVVAAGVLERRNLSETTVLEVLLVHASMCCAVALMFR